MFSPILKIGPLALHWYGLFVAAAIWLAIIWSERRAKRRGLPADFVWDAAFWVVFGGLIGGRLYHVLNFWSYYQGSLWEVFFVWRGGLGIYGALVGGWLAFALLWFVNRRNPRSGPRLDFFRWLDVVSPALLLGQAVGRIGNFFNYELYGWPTTSFLGMYVPPQYRLWSVAPFSTFHPLFLYESVWCLVGLGILLEVERRWQARLIDGALFFLYLLLYAGGRFYLEGLRIESWTIGGWRVAQAISGAVFLAAIGCLLIKRGAFLRKGLTRP
ncbi:MAG: prolipoprotein diacylglyceryl transferase [bacterium]|nr:prolipoprotein diacylglyceryl transferase [bacterium]